MAKKKETPEPHEELPNAADVRKSGRTVDPAPIAPVTVKRYRGKQLCERCRNLEAEWTVDRPGFPAQHLCDTHARYWAAVYGLDRFPSDQ